MRITKKQLKRIISEDMSSTPLDIIDGDTGEIYADWEKPEWNDQQFSGMEADFEIWLSNPKNKDFVRHPDSEALTKEHGPAWWVHNEWEEARAAKRAKRLSAPLVGKYNLPADGWGIPEGKIKIRKSELNKLIREMYTREQIVAYLQDKAEEYYADKALAADGPGAIKLLLQDDFMDDLGHVADMQDYADLIDDLAKGTADVAEGTRKMRIKKSDLKRIIAEEVSKMNEADMTNDPAIQDLLRRAEFEKSKGRLFQGDVDEILKMARGGYSAADIKRIRRLRF